MIKENITVKIDPKISVIIPVYRVEKYLSECVRSVISQTYKNLEIILVDDGSDDSSPQLCDGLACSDSRIRVIHKPNGGLSSARNAGLGIATGDYVLFLDSDDFWDNPNAVSRLVERVHKTDADVLSFSYIKFFEDTNEKEPYFNAVDDMPVQMKNCAERFDLLTGRGLYIASACNKLIKRSLISNDLFFREGVFSEDIEWCLKLLARSESPDFVCENFYCYRQRKNSIRHTIDEKKCNDLCDNLLRCFNICANTPSELREYLYRYLAYQYGTFYLVQAQTDFDPTECIKRLIPYAWILKYGRGFKLSSLRAASAVLGMSGVCRIIRAVYRR